MGDHRAGSAGPTAIADNPPSPFSADAPVAAAGSGKRAARHAQEPRTSQPYVGRRVAGATPPPPPVAVPPSASYAGRRVAGRSQVAAVIAPEPTPAPLQHVMTPKRRSLVRRW